MSSSLETVGRYKILRPLGAGAMGEVYLALDPNIDRRLAIKTVRLTGAVVEIEDRKQRLLREAKAAGRLLHPNVVTLFDAGEEDGLLYLAFEFVDGPDLSRRMGESPPLSLGLILRWVREIASALEAAHRQGIIHRDIKPSNILIGGEGEAKVADFGIAKLAGAATQLTQTGSVVGSPQYMSPEQIRGEELDGRSDLFSLGVMLYELLSRRRPFEGETLSTLVFQILSEEPIAIDRLHPQLPPPLTELVHHMLAKSRDDRLSSAAEVVEAVAAVERTLPPERLAAPLPPTADTEATTLMPSTSATHLPTRVAPPPPPPLPSGGTYATPRAGRRTGLLAVAGLILAAVIGWGVLSYLFPDGTEGGKTLDEGTANGQNVEEPPPDLPDETELGRRPPETNEGSQTTSAIPPGGQGDDTVQEPPPPTQLEQKNGGAATPPPEKISTTNPGNVPPPPAQPPPQVSSPPPPAVPSVTPPPPTERPAVKPPAPPPPPVSLPPPPPSEPAPPPPSPEPAEDTASSRFEAAAGEAERELETGLRLHFQVEPDDALVKTWARGDERSIVHGRTSQFDPKEKDSRTLDLPGDGDYLIILSREGLPDETILVTASSARGLTPTPIRASLRVRGAAGPKLIVVSQAVSFAGSPSSAVVYVDDRNLGPVSQWPGARRANSDRNLQLDSGTHSLRIEAPGYRPYELTVDVRADASDKRAMIRFELRR